MKKYTIIPSRLLALAHILTVYAFLAFGVRAGGYPVHWAGLSIYFVLIVALSIALVMNLLKHPPSYTEADLLVLVEPAYASLVLQAALWLGGAPYAPYDPGDADIVMFSNLLFAVTFALCALVAGSFRYLAVSGLIQTIVYFSAYALPHYWRYPTANILGARPEIFIAIIGVYILAGLAFTRRNKMNLPALPGLPFAISLVTLVGAMVLLGTLNWLPQNGAYLGYNSVTVPLNAWDWSLSLAQGLAALTIVGAVVSIVIAFIRWFITRLRPKLEPVQ